MSKTISDLSANESIYESIKQIALHNFTEPNRNVVKNTRLIHGYVVKVHTDPGDILCGTVDVQEYISNLNEQQAIKKGLKVGYHEGVYLSAIQNNENGVFVIPFLYSDVVVSVDPDTLKKYVIQYSHADKVHIDAHNHVVIGVTETKPYDNSEDSPDYDELERTGVYSRTTYTPTSAIIEVAKTEDTASKSNISVTADSIVSEHDKAKILIDAKNILAKYNAKEIVIKEDGVYLGSDGASEPGVLGNQLASLLVEWLTVLSQMITPTMMGPQPPANVAQFVQLQSKVNQFKASMSGFLSKTVKVAE